jgi:pimeloyl-ACP methyl ester carboxylesterase
VIGPKPPLVLLHPFTSSGRIWDEVVPLLANHHEVHTPTLLGHRGGPAPRRRPVTWVDMVDDGERWLDENGLERPHLVGNSGGGAGAIELARRGRAASVCAISPAGFWSTSDGSAARVIRLIRLGGKVFRVMNPMAPLLLKTRTGRRITLRNFIRHGERLSAQRALELFFVDPLGCTIMNEVEAVEIEPLDPLPCPITLAWAEFDHFVPAEPYGRIARERLPGARWVDLTDTGHNAMVDDPALVARTILATTGAI